MIFFKKQQFFHSNSDIILTVKISIQNVYFQAKPVKCCIFNAIDKNEHFLKYTVRTDIDFDFLS